MLVKMYDDLVMVKDHVTFFLLPHFCNSTAVKAEFLKFFSRNKDKEDLNNN